MDAGYVIFDTWTSNLVGTFPDEEAALACVRRAVEEDGPEAVNGWAIARTDGTGEVLSDEVLVQRVMT